MEPADVDPRLKRALERVPAPLAPETLLPRVMQALELRVHAPWYRRAWRQWPLAWQGLSIAASIGLIALVLDREPSAGLTQLVATESLAPAQAVTNQVEPTVAALQILWTVVFEPFMPGLFAIAMLMFVLCVAIGLLLNYVVMGRTWQR